LGFPVKVAVGVPIFGAPLLRLTQPVLPFLRVLLREQRP